MKNKLNIKYGVACAALSILALTLMTTSLSGADNQRLRVPQDTSIPLLVTGLGHTGTNAGDWVVAAFYYPTAVIDADQLMCCACRIG